MFKDAYGHARKYDLWQRYSRKMWGLACVFNHLCLWLHLKNEVLTIWVKCIRHHRDKWATLSSQQSTWRSGLRRRQWRKMMLKQPPCLCKITLLLGLVVRRCWLVTEFPILWIKWSWNLPRISKLTIDFWLFTTLKRSAKHNGRIKSYVDFCGSW